MKKLKKYEEFFLLNENSEKSLDKKISEDEFWKLYNKNCKTHTYIIQNSNSKNKFSQEIFKGIYDSTEPFLYSERSSGPYNFSKYDPNWSNILISNLRSWSKYPKYLKSLICTTSKEDAKTSGNVYVVIPYDNAIFGICPENDIRYSFKKWFKNDIVDLNTFDTILDEFFRIALNKKYEDDTAYVNLIQNFEAIEQLDKSDIYEILSTKERINFGLRHIFLDFDNFIEDVLNKKTTFLKYLEDKMLPEKNGFKLIKYNNFFDKEKIQSGGPKEIWTSSPCLLVSQSFYFTNIYDKIKQL